MKGTWLWVFTAVISLSLIHILFQRRNMIAHQSDRRHADAQKEPISRETVEEFIADVEKIVAAVVKEAERKQEA